jgi:hypothetical protein
MEPHEDYAVLRVVGEQTLDSEVDDQLSGLQAIGNSALRYLRQGVALGGATALLLAMGPFTADTDATHTNTSPPEVTPPEVTLRATPHHIEKDNSSPRSIRSRIARFNCTWITDYPRGYYIGEACSDDKLIKMWSSPSHQYDYGMFIVNGVDKCGWAKKDVVPTMKAKGDPQGCQTAYKPLLNPHSILKNIECNPVACDDGTVRTPLSSACDHKFFQNFATRSKSPLNLDPHHDKNGFSGYIGEHFGSVHYRATITSNSAAGPAIMVRSDTLGWGMMSAKCASSNTITSAQPGAVSVPASQR